VLALKGNQTSLHEDVQLFFADPALTASCAASAETDAGHGRIEERACRAAHARWLAERHPEWVGLRSVAAVAARRTDKKTGRESLETRFYITSLAPDPKAILAATRAHWAVESFHWALDVTFDEDRCRTRKDASALGLAVTRHTGYNILRADRSRGSLRRKRIRACIDPAFRDAVGEGQKTAQPVQSPGGDLLDAVPVVGAAHHSHECRQQHLVQRIGHHPRDPVVRHNLHVIQKPNRHGAASPTPFESILVSPTLTI
jgi:predicted transposase YbfD/YdcC